MKEANPVRDKSFQFSVRIVKLCNFLATTKKEFVISKQLARCGTSIGANVVEGLHSISKKEFLAKMYIAYKESAEGIYWLKLLFACEYINQEQYNSLLADCEELYKMLSSITKTLRINIEKEESKKK